MRFAGELTPLLPLRWFDTDEARVRVCGVCGIIDWFVTPSTLEAVKQRFTRES